jgi:hypothetical protein
MKKIVRLTESDLIWIVKQFLNEERDSLWVNNNPYNPKDTGINGSWKFENGKITLHNALKGDKTL